MKKHIKNYYKANELDYCDDVFCKNCLAVAVDIHHIKPKGRGGTDEASNLVALCRNCHQLAHNNKLEYKNL